MKDEKPMQVIKQTERIPDPLFNIEDTSAQVALIQRAGALAPVVDAKTQSAAVEVARDVRAHLKEVEEARKQLKEPILAAGRLLDGLATAYCEPLKRSLNVIEGGVARFQEAEARRVAEEERKRNEEIERRLAEQRELEAKAQALAEKARTERQLDRAIEAEERARDAAQVAQAVVMAPLPEKSRESGTAVQKVLRWECVSVHALYAARPELCVVEPKASAIKACCFAAAGATAAKPDSQTVPGLKLWWETKVTVRA